MEEDFKNLLIKAREIVAKNEQIMSERKRHGDFFNIFSILGAETKENRHSAFIAELLNPNGSHGFNDLFLQIFLSCVGFDTIQSEIKTSYLDTKHAIVEREKYFGEIRKENDKDIGGFADIFINFKDKTGQSFVIVIENKINAGEQEKQVTRYINSIKSRHCLVLYLTLYGNSPSNYSLVDEENKFNLGCISYFHHIIHWLNKCTELLTVNQPPVFYIIKQYLSIIKRITHQENKNMNNELKNMLLEPNKNNLALVEMLYRETQNLRLQTLIIFLKLLKDFFEKNKKKIEIFYKYETSSTKAESAAQRFFSLKDENNRYITVRFPVFEKYGLWYQFTFNDVYWHGFILSKEKTDIPKDIENKLRSVQLDDYDIDPCNNWLLVRKNAYLPIDFINMDEGFRQFAAATGTEKSQMIQKVVDSIENDIKKILKDIE